MGTFAILAAIYKEIAQLQQARNLLSGTERRGRSARLAAEWATNWWSERSAY